VTLHTIFGESSPGTFSVFNDGQPTTVGHVFQVAATDATPWEIAAGRLYVSSVTPKGAQAIISLSVGADVGSPIREVEFTTPATEGWVEVPWEPYVPVKGTPHTVSVRFPGRVDYFAAPSPGAAAIVSSTLPALSIYGTEGAPSRSLFRYGTSGGGVSPSGPLWGLDVVLSDGEPIEEEPPANLVPTIELGSPRTMYVGQTATITAMASDVDGTLASYDWWQVSGPPVTLSGSGNARSFTPSVVGTYVFAATVTDDDGATSPADSVTVTVLAVPVEIPDTPPSASLRPFGMVERAVKQAIVAKMPDAAGKIGGDLSFDAAEDDFYIFIALVPGRGNGSVFGEWAVDVDVFDQNYTQAMRRALEIEALLITPGGHRTPEMRLDFGTQNAYPAERPWDDESSARIGATYVFTARRPG